jgi:hypothetical protein
MATVVPLSLLATLAFGVVLAGAWMLTLRWHAWRALVRGHLGRCDDLAEVFPFRTSAQRELLRAETAFWGGSFEEALGHLDPSRADHAPLAALALVMLDRSDEARTLLESRPRASGTGRPTLRVATALMLVAEGDTAGARHLLEPILLGADPLRRLARHTCAVLALERGESDVGARLLESVIEDGGRLFVVHRAIELYRHRFPLRALPESYPSESAPWSQLGNLAFNLASGLRLVTMRRVRRGLFVASVEQLALLVLVNMLVAFVPLLTQYVPDGVFNRFGALESVQACALVLPLAYAAGRIVAKRDALATSAVMFLAATPLLVFLVRTVGVLIAPGNWPSIVEVPTRIHAYEIALGAATLWSAAVIVRVVHAFGQTHFLVRAGAISVLYLSVVFGVFFGGPPSVMWFPPYKGSGFARHMDLLDDDDLVPGVLEKQPVPLSHALERLPGQRHGLPDLYFIGFAGWGSQDVFANEVDSFASLFRMRVTTEERALELVNDDRDPDRGPLATKANLDVALRYVGSVMDTEEDLLFLFLTSHGSATSLGVKVLGTRLEGIGPVALRESLDASGIKWRVVVISACRSGGFVEPLREEHTLVATAAAVDRESFGCQSGREFTEYGRAVYEHLSGRTGLVSALEEAARDIADKERAEGRDASLPQLDVGKLIEAKLHEAW